MDFAGAKRALTERTRALAGETVTIRPMKDGRLKPVEDAGRPVQTGIPVRFDFGTDTEKLGGSDRTGPLLNVERNETTVTVPKHLLSWEPDKLDRFERANGEVWEVVRPGVDGAGVMIFWLSRV